MFTRISQAFYRHQLGRTSAVLRNAYPILPLLSRSPFSSTSNARRFLYGAAAAAAATVTGVWIISNEWNAEEANPSPRIYKIVLTGGPCGGKSTALSQIMKRLPEFGFKVYCVPEVATLIFTGGAGRGATKEESLALNTTIIRSQMALEEAFTNIARASGKPSVIICDRGVCDNRAFVSKSDWELILDVENFKLIDLRDNRYDAVIHLVSAAIGAEKFYTTSNNTARIETVDEARALDYKVLDAWIGHPHLRVVDNSTDFQSKVRRVVDSICSVVGLPHPVEQERRFIVSNVGQWPADIKYEDFDVEMTFLITTDGSQARLWRRGQQGSNTYIYSVKRKENDKFAIEERHISAREYVALMAQKETTRSTVHKKMRVFMWNNTYYALNYYLEPSGLVIMEAEDPTLRPAEKLVPPFITVSKEVSNDDNFSSYGLSVVA